MTRRSRDSMELVVCHACDGAAFVEEAAMATVTGPSTSSSPSTGLPAHVTLYALRLFGVLSRDTQRPASCFARRSALASLALRAVQGVDGGLNPGRIDGGDRPGRKLADKRWAA